MSQVFTRTQLGEGNPGQDKGNHQLDGSTQVVIDSVRQLVASDENKLLKAEIERLRLKSLLDDLVIEAMNDGADGVAIIDDIESGIMIRTTNFVKFVAKNALAFSGENAGNPINVDITDGETSLHHFHDLMIGTKGTQRAKEKLSKMNSGDEVKNAVLKIKLENGSIKYVRTITKAKNVGGKIYYVTSFIDLTSEVEKLNSLKSDEQNLESRIDVLLGILKIMLEIELKVFDLKAIVQKILDERKKVTSLIEQVGGKLDEQGEFTHEMGKDLRRIVALSKSLRTLALNSKIEALRAGDYGEGFKVVAEETKRIAENAGALAIDTDEKILPQLRAIVSGLKEDMGLLSKLNSDRTNIDLLESVLSGFREIVASYGNMPGIGESLRQVNSGIKEQTESNQVLTDEQKILAHLRLTKMDHKIFAVELLLQLVSFNPDYEVSLHTKCDLGRFVLGPSFTKLVGKYLELGMENPTLQNFQESHKEVHKAAGEIRDSIISLNNLTDDTSKGDEIRKISEIINGDFSRKVGDVLSLIDSLHEEFSNKMDKRG